MPVAQFLIAAAAVANAPFTDQAKQYSVHFPRGWSAPVTDADGNTESDAPTGGLYCRTNFHTVATLKDLTQADINTKLRQPLSRDGWAGVYVVDASKIQISEGRTGLVAGHLVQSVTIALDGSLVGGSPKKGRFAAHVLPGRMINVGCFAPPESFDRARPLFEKVVGSLKPL